MASDREAAAAPWIVPGPARRGWTIPSAEQLAEWNGTDAMSAATALDDMASDSPHRWTEIEPWLGRRLTVRQKAIVRPAEPAWICPTCGRAMRFVYWEQESPPAWLCARSGFVEVCRPCQWWGRFILHDVL